MRYWLLFWAIFLFNGSALAFNDDEDDDNGRPQLNVVIEGVSGQLLTNVRNRLGIYNYHQQPSPGPARVRFLHRRAEQEILRALAPAGFYRASVETEFERDNGVWRLTYRITPGPAMPIRNVDIRITGDAENDDAFNRLIRNLNIQPGQDLHHRNYDNAKNRIRSLAADRGYRNARFERSELQIDLNDYAADILIEFDSGTRFRFGDVRFSEAQLDEDILQRFVQFEQGEYITSDELVELQMALSDSDYFSRVQIQPLWDEASDDAIVPVAINVEPNNRTHYRAGLGYGTDTGARVLFEQNRRWVNTRGHRFNSQFQFSELISAVGANYIIPGRQPQTDQYVLRAGWRDEDTSTTRSELVNLGVSWQRQLERTQRTIALDWQDERDTFSGERRDTQFLIPSVQWNRVHTPDRLNVREGFRTSLALRGASDAVLSSTDFAQATLGAKYVFSFAEHYRLLTRGELGTTVASDFDRIPTSLRFYAGGDSSIRGYGYRSIGPRDEDGIMLGGRHLMVGSIELDYEFRPNFRVATFWDAGNAFNDITSATRHGAGFGFRWQSPVGPIRIDLAHGFGPEGDKVSLHLTLGPDL
ncbi:autotransporter assembly complex protein TamA [Aliidiomarina maris]|uniref:Translocation and assembly module subunit TamA n=1 Tax=Aliidiomarina maris TaxID=531312 RepID=A0A327WUW0_9GAMM|nr:autotransporter assembly complex family protein [Aliidiomarina maris]RAJ96424.1 autotransporter secretion outer membrane protein TamA [Aliidiomarina maris]RUO22801.1 outer membrane protein assembly factor [Aliidiomarina maris]